MGLLPDEKFRQHKASKALQAKAGLGPLNMETVERCEKIMKESDVDFAPLATEYLAALEKAIDYSRNNPDEKDKAIAAMTVPVMQLKAHAATFKYSLIGNLANVMLSFLETIKDIDGDALTIVQAHHTTIHAIVSKKLTGNGGEVGRAMQEELQKACDRYRAKRRTE